MKKLNRTNLTGFVVNLPDSLNEVGVILDATKYCKNLYKMTILSKDNYIIIAKVKCNTPEINEPIEYIDFHAYNALQIANTL